MKYVKNIIFFISIVAIMVALFINIIIVNAGKSNIDLDFLTSLNNTVYMDTTQLSAEQTEKINTLINSNNPAVFSKMITDKDPVIQFYGFCGYMKSNQKQAIGYLEKMLISTKKVQLYYREKNYDTTLGFAVLTLLSDFPVELTNKPYEGFYADSKESVRRVQFSQVVKSDERFSRKLSDLIDTKYPTLVSNDQSSKKIFDNLKTKTIDEKIALSNKLNQAPEENRSTILSDLLMERNDKITLNVLNAITENDSVELANEIYKILNTTTSDDIALAALKKYSLIYKKEAVRKVETYVKSVSPSKETLVLESLEILAAYSDESSYEFLKMFLETVYSTQVNIACLKTMIATTYPTNPSNVMKTLLFVIRYLPNVKVAEYAIRFHIDRKITENSSIILNRLSKKESDNMKNLALEYIGKLSVKEGLSLLKELAEDTNPTISQKAKDLITQLETP